MEVTESINLHNMDDCTTVVLIKDKDGIPVAPYSNIDFKITYYTTPQYEYEASRINGVLSNNCSISGDYIYVYIDGFDWGKLGRAYMKISVGWVNEHFPDGKENVSVVCLSAINVISPTQVNII